MSMPQAVRHINAMRALETIFRKGPMSRASLARALNLTRSTASSIVAELIQSELLVEDTNSEDRGDAARTGRPGTLVRLKADRSTFVGADIEVGQITTVAVDLEAHVISTNQQPFPFETSSADDVTRLLLTAVDRLIRRLSASRRVEGICVTVPGIVDAAGTVVRLPIMGWRDVPLLPRLRAAFPDVGSILVENDANAFAMAEHYLSQRDAPSQAIHIFLDAGVGGAFMIGQQLQRGSHGYAGEIGHIPLGGRGFFESSPLPGSAKSYLGREAILARHRFYGGVAETFDDYLRCLDADTAASQTTLHDWATHFGRMLAALTALFDPVEIIVGGPVSALFDTAQRDVEDCLRGHLMPGQPAPHLRRSSLGVTGPALGGAFILHRHVMTVNQELVYGFAR